MPATLVTLRTHVRDMLAEASPREWTEAQLNTWINEGARDVVRHTETLMATGSVTTIAGTQTYTLAGLSPAPFRLHRCDFQPSGGTVKYPLEWRDFATMDEVWGTSQAITQGIPQYWTLWGAPGVTATPLTLYLYPAPSSVGAVTIYYYRLPTPAVADNDPLEIPEGWDDLIVHYAEYRALRKDRDQRWQEAFQLYTQLLEDMTTMVGARYTDQAGTMVHAGAVPYGMPWLIDY